MSRHATIADLLTRNGGTLPAHFWPGGYPVIYYVEENDQQLADVVCAACATMVVLNPGEWSWSVWGYDTYMEGTPETCTHCHKEIESAYGAEEGDADGGNCTDS